MPVNAHNRFLLGSALAGVVVVCSAMARCQPHETVLYSFGSNSADGTNPNGALVIDTSGNVYGTTNTGGSLNSCRLGAGCGTVFELTPGSDGKWTEIVLYNFTGGNDGGNPLAGVTLDGAGNIFGTAASGGALGKGTVFELVPPSSPDGSWTELTLWTFGGSSDGATPAATLTLDTAGNLYGSTAYGGTLGGGTVFELSPPVPPADNWAETVLYSFCQANCSNGSNPSGVVFDGSGNLFGATNFGGLSQCQPMGCGTAFELSPSQGGGWTHSIIFHFTTRGGGEPTGLTMYRGNVYGGLQKDGPACCGGIFQLAFGNGKWLETLVPFADPGALVQGVFLAGNSAYGVSFNGGTQRRGYVFRITGKTKNVLYNFCSQPNCTDGADPAGTLVEYTRKLYGVTVGGGTNFQGTIYSIEP